MLTNKRRLEIANQIANLTFFGDNQNDVALFSTACYKIMVVTTFNGWQLARAVTSKNDVYRLRWLNDYLTDEEKQLAIEVVALAEDSYLHPERYNAGGYIEQGVKNDWWSYSTFEYILQSLIENPNIDIVEAKDTIERLELGYWIETPNKLKYRRYFPGWDGSK